MQKILVMLALFFFAFFVMDRTITYYFSRKIFAETLSGESGGSLNFLLAKKRNIDFLILGSSRAKHQIDPAILTNVYGGNGYNAGINGVGTVVYNSVLLDILIKNGILPKVIILQTDLYQFNDNGSKIESEIIPLYPYIEQSALLNNYINYAERIKLLIHAYRFNGKFLNILFNYFKRHSVSDNTGFVGLKVNMDSTNLPKKSAQASPKLAIAKKKMEALRHIVQLCARHDIKLVVVIPPFYNNVSNNSEGNKHLFNAMRAEGVHHLLDFSDVRSIPGLTPAAVWKDKDHLNNTGATLFSKVINEHLLSIVNDTFIRRPFLNVTSHQ